MEKLVNGVKLLSYLLLVVSLSSHAHKAVNTYVGKFIGIGLQEHLSTFFQGESELCRLLSNMYLEQAGDDAVAFLTLLTDFCQEFVRVNSMDETDERGDVFDFVGLQMADKVPTDVFGELFVFLAQLLHVTFAKNALTGIVCLHNGFSRVVF